jgi:protein-disulfide isomerase
MSLTRPTSSTFTRRVFSALTMGSALFLAACGGSDAPDTSIQTSFERAADRGIGSADAAVTMIEYASVACPHCRSFHEEVWPMLESEYIDSDQVRFVFREMITGQSAYAIAGFQLAHCVPEERYFDMVDLLFQQQSVIFQAGRTGSAREQYRNIARQMGLSSDEFAACLSNEAIQQEVLDSHNQALDDGINSTPVFIFNGARLESRQAQNATDHTYFLGGRQILIDGEPVPAIEDEPTFRRILDHLLSEADSAAE